MADEQPESLVDRYRATTTGAIEYAAAELTATVARLLQQMRRISPVRQKDVAAALDVTEGRVSQVLHGDGNITVAAVAKYARALGYSISITATPLPDFPPLRSSARRAPRVIRARADKRVATGDFPFGIHAPWPGTSETSTVANGRIHLYEESR